MTTKLGTGIFPTLDEAVAAAKKAQKEYGERPLSDRDKIITAIRKEMVDHADEYAQETVDETGFGKVAHKVEKIKLASLKTPGIEDLTTETLTGTDGMAMYEMTPYGVIGAILPSTNPTATIINNGIGMLAAGNAVYFSLHPQAAVVSKKMIEHINRIIEREIGIQNLFVTMDQPTMDTVNELFAHEDISILVITGGPGIVSMGLSSGKKTIGAGAGNPPILVDETADLKQAAKGIFDSASFDNGILCTAEKSILVVEDVFEAFIDELVNVGAYLMTEEEVETISDLVFVEGKPNKEYIGKDASYILTAAGIEYDGDPELLILKADLAHPLVMTEMLMPILPVTSVQNFEAGVEAALIVEQNNKHTSGIYSADASRINRYARVMNTSMTIANGPTFIGLGYGGEGPTTFTIATPTGEGTTSARHFTRRRKLTLSDGFSLK